MQQAIIFPFPSPISEPTPLPAEPSKSLAIVAYSRALLNMFGRFAEPILIRGPISLPIFQHIRRPSFNHTLQHSQLLFPLPNPGLSKGHSQSY